MLVLVCTESLHPIIFGTEPDCIRLVFPLTKASFAYISYNRSPAGLFTSGDAESSGTIPVMACHALGLIMNADNRYRLLLQNLLIAGAYWAISHINMLFFTSFGVLPMPIWPAASLAVAVSLFMGLRGAPGIAAGALLSNALSLGSTFPVAAGIAVMNTLGPLAGALLIKRSAVMNPPFFRLRDTGLFLLYGVIVMAALTATGGTASILAGGRITLEAVPLSWLRWWIAHASGALLFTPMLLCWLSDRTLPSLKEGLTCFGVCSVTLLVTAGVFFFINGSREPWSGLTYLLILPLVWGALHFKVRETMTLYLCMFLAAIIATVMGHGPFAGNQFPLLPLGEMAVGFGLTALLLCAVVSERRQTEEALKKNEAKYRIVADNTYDWEFWLSPEERFIYLSPSCEKITGYSPREFEKDSGLLQHIIHPEDKEIFNQHRHSVCMIHAPAETEFRIIRRDGHSRWIHHVCQPVFDEDGRFLGTRGSNRDVTDNKLKESENIMLSSAVEHAAETVMVFDPGGIIHYVNTALLQLTGFSKEEMVGQSAFPHDSTLEKYQQYRDALAKIQQGEVWSGVVPIKRKNGTSYQSETTVSPIKDAANKPVSFVVIGRDITKERLMEEQLRQSQKMEAIGTLAGGIAHDFNNILGAIMGYTELSRDETAAGTAAGLTWSRYSRQACALETL